MTTESVPPADRSIVVDAMNDPSFDWTRTPAMRRRLVLVSMALTIALVLPMLAIWYFDWRGPAAAPSRRIALGVAGGVLLLWMLLTGYLNASVRGTADPIVARLRGGHDEWQRRLYDSTFRRCYGPIVGIMGVAAIANIVLKPPVVLALSIVLGIFLVAVMAPLWTMAWTLPQDLREE